MRFLQSAQELARGARTWRSRALGGRNVLKNALAWGLLLLGAFSSDAMMDGGAEVLPPPPPLFFTHPLNLGVEAYSMLQDREGFLWIVTAHSGMAKYDGREVRFLKCEPGKLSTSTVVAAREDHRGVLWIATAGGGLNAYDKETDSVQIFRHQEDDPSSLNSDTFSYRNHGNQVLLEDRQGRLWCGTNRGVDRLESDDRRGVFFVHVPFADGAPRMVHALLEDRRGRIWVGTDKGLARIDAAGERAESVAEGLGGILKGHPVFCLLEDRQGNLWTGGTTGLHRFDASGDVRHISAGNRAPGMPDMAVNSLTEDAEGRLILGSTMGPPGMWRWDPETGRCAVYRHDPSDVRSLGTSALPVRSSFLDRQGTLWVLHGTGKIDLGSFSGGPFRIWRREKILSRGLAENIVGGVVRDEEGSLWFATFGGLDHYDPKKDLFHHFSHVPGDGGTLPHRAATALAKDRRHRLWVGSPAGLSLFDRSSNRMIRHVVAPAIYAICPDPLSDDVLWLGTMDQGLLRYHVPTDTWRRMPLPLSSDEDRRVHHKIWSVVPDREDPTLLWLPIFGGGLDCFDTRKEHWQHVVGTGGRAECEGSDRVTAILQDRRGRFWVGTDDRGLLSFDRKKKTFTPISLDFGGGVLSAWSLEEDAEGQLWMGTQTGLWCFNAEALTLRSFVRGDGLPEESFLPRSAATEDGRLWFMTLEGMVSVLPSSLKKNTTPPPVYLAALRRQGVPLTLGQAPERVRELTLRWPDNAFEFDFVALNYLFPEKNRYAYKLEGIDTTWFHAGDRGTGRYVGLPGGTYVLRMKASNNDGVWSAEGASLRVVVVPSFWERWTFRGAVGGGLLASALLFWFWRTRRIRARQLDLSLKVRQRTSQLAAANDRLQREIQERRRAEEALRSLLVTDELTGLCNRRGFYERARAMEAQAWSLSRPLFVIYMDMDDFKEINDSFGHTVGDEALREMGALLKNVFGDEPVLARLGGDEFVVLGFAEEGERFGLRLRDHFRKALEDRNARTSRPYRLNLSLGMSLGRGEMGDVELLVREADDAMYAEKMAQRLRRLRKEHGDRAFFPPPEE